LVCQEFSLRLAGVVLYYRNSAQASDINLHNTWRLRGAFVAL